MTARPRLPVVSPRGGHAPPPSSVAAAAGLAPRIRAPRALLCVSGDVSALAFACALTGELGARGVPAWAMVEPGARAAAEALRAAGAEEAELASGGDVAQAACTALEALPEDALVIGVGAAFAARFEPLLGIAVGTVAVAAGADLALPAPSAALASTIGAWLADRLRSGRTGPTFSLVEPAPVRLGSKGSP